MSIKCGEIVSKQAPKLHKGRFLGPLLHISGVRRIHNSILVHQLKAVEKIRASCGSKVEIVNECW